MRKKGLVELLSFQWKFNEIELERKELESRRENKKSGIFLYLGDVKHLVLSGFQVGFQTGNRHQSKSSHQPCFFAFAFNSPRASFSCD